MLQLEELCSRTHLLFVNASGELRDCGELPASRDEAPELGEYRRSAAVREKVRLCSYYDPMVFHANGSSSYL